MTRPDIEQRLTERAQEGDDYLSPTALWLQPEDVALLREAAEEIRRLREALRPFAREAEEWANYKGDEDLRPMIGAPDQSTDDAYFTVGDLRHARATLHPTEPHET